jgi:hypothetical protein
MSFVDKLTIMRAWYGDPENLWSNENGVDLTAELQVSIQKKDITF